MDFSIKNRSILSLFVILCLTACHDKAALKQALIEIYDTISSEGVRYQDVKEQIRKVWISTNYNNFNQMGIGHLACH